MPLGLGKFGYVDQHGHMRFTCNVGRIFVNVDQGRIIPALYPEYFISGRILGALESLEDLRDVLFGGLEFGRH